jgi:hypothetical protein
MYKVGKVILNGHHGMVPAKLLCLSRWSCVTKLKTALLKYGEVRDLTLADARQPVK